MDCWRNRATARGRGAVAIVLFGCGMMLGSTGVAHAQAGRPGDLPDAIRTAANAKQYAREIDQFVKTNLEKLVDPANARPGATRDELSRQPEPPPANVPNALQPSASFQLQYVDSVLGNLDILMQKDAGARVNAAIIIQRLAAATKAPQLQTTIVKLLNDPSPAVALWGLKASGALLPTLLSQPFLANGEQLTKGIVDAAKKHSGAAAIAQEAYTALDVSGVQPALPKPMLEKCVTRTLEVVRTRIDLWTTGVPVEAHAENQAIGFLTRSGVFSGLGRPAKLDIAQHVMDLLAVTTRRAGVLPPGEQQKVYELANRAAGGMFVLMKVEGKPEIASRFDLLQKLPGTLSAGDIQKTFDLALGGVKSLPDYQTLKEPPKLQQAAAQ